MIEKEDCLKIGAIQKAHGINGELSLFLEPGIDSDMLDEGQFVFLDLENGLVPFKIESLRTRGEHGGLVYLTGIDSETIARQMVGTTLWVEKNSLTIDEEQFPATLLIGYSIIDDVAGDLGTLTEILDSDKNPLMVVTSKGEEILIPLADDFILSIDDNKKIINVSLPEGLVDLNK